MMMNLSVDVCECGCVCVCVESSSLELVLSEEIVELSRKFIHCCKVKTELTQTH